MPDKKDYKELSKREPLSDVDIEKLSRDPTIREALIRLKMDVLISGWVVKGSSDAVALFCRHILSRVWVEMVMLLLEALTKGTQICEVVWGIQDEKVLGRSYPASIVPKAFFAIPKRYARFLWDAEKRELAGIRVLKSDTTKTTDLLGEKVLWYSFAPSEKSWPLGTSLLENVRPMEEMFGDAMNLLGAYVENLTIPPVIGYAPPGELPDPESGEVVGGLEYMTRRLRELRASGIGVFPTDLTPEGHPRWRIDFQTGAAPAGSVEIARILEILQTFKRDSIYAKAEGGAMMAGQLPVGLPGFVLRELLDALNKQIVKKLVFLNWGEEEWAYIEPADQAADIGLVRDIVRSSIQFSDVERQRILKLLDWYALLQMFGLPLAMEEKKEETAAQAPLGLAGLGGLGALPGIGMPSMPGLAMPAPIIPELPEAAPPAEAQEATEGEQAWRAAIQGP